MNQDPTTLREPSTSPKSAQPVNIGLATAAAVGAIFVGIGLARLGFAPLEPALVTNGWFSGGGAALLAATNLGGYLLGTLSGSHMARHIRATTLLRLMMLAIAVSFLACADASFPFAWFLFWRVVSGFAGGVIMGLAGPTVLAHVPERRRALIGQLLLYGITGGILVAGALMPVVLASSVELGWIVLGLLSLLATVLTWRLWPASPSPVAAAKAVPERARLFCLQYGLVAIGVVPQMIFLVDYIARDLGRGVNVGSHFFLLYGLGSLSGPLLYTFVTGKIGLRKLLRAGIVVQLVADLLLLTGSSTAILAAASFMAGLGAPALIAAFLLRSQQITEGDPIRHRALWGVASASFAVGQAGAAFGTAFLLDRFGEGGLGYPLLFTAGSAALLVALLLDFAIRR